jgi:hypothetical protein
MDRDTFIIAVYCLVVEHYRAHAALYPMRHGGFAPELSDEEVITMEICGAYLQPHTDQDLLDYCHAHYRHFFPRLTDRTVLIRQAANLWQVKAAIQQRVVRLSGQAAAPVQAIDTLPVPGCTSTRGGRRDRGFPCEADYGYWAATQLHYYGCKLGLRLTRCGRITHSPLLTARPHDSQHLEALVAGVSGIVPADKGFMEAVRHALLQSRHHIIILTPPRARMAPPPYSRALLKAAARWRKRPETVGAQLTERFAIARIRVRDLWHFQHRVIRKVLAHTVCMFLNLQLDRAPMD